MAVNTASIKVLGIDFTIVDSAQKHELGLEVQCNDGSRRRYVKSTTTIAANDALTYTAVSNVLASTTAASQPVAGVCPVAGVSGTSFFWAIVKALAVTVKAATVAALAPLVTTATSGTLDDTAASAGNALAAASGVGVWSLTVDAGGVATVALT